MADLMGSLSEIEDGSMEDSQDGESRSSEGVRSGSHESQEPSQEGSQQEAYEEQGSQAAEYEQDVDSSSGSGALDKRDSGGDVEASPDDFAEVILIGTSLQSIRTQFHETWRAQNLLDCKQCLYVSLDVNRDVSQARNLKDIDLINEWKEKATVLLAGEELRVPQIIIGGKTVNGLAALQALEDDGDLDWLIAKAACPHCLAEKSGDDCRACGRAAQRLIPKDHVLNGYVNQIYRGALYNSTETYDKQMSIPQ